MLNRRMILILALAGLALVAQPIWKRIVGRQPDGTYLLPTGQVVRPFGKIIEVNDRPLGIAMSPDGRIAAVVTGSNFAARALHLVDIATAQLTQTLPVADSFTGVAFTSDGNTLYVGGGSSHAVLVFVRPSAQQPFAAAESIAIPNGAPSGLALSPDGQSLFVACNQRHAVARITLATRKVDYWTTGSYPYTVAIAKGKLFVSNWGGRKPLANDTTDGLHPVVVDKRTGIPSSGTISAFDLATGTLITELEVGLHPSALVVSPDQSKLYVANANSDTVAEISTGMPKLERSIAVPLYKKAPLGSSPNALAIHPDGRTLFVANAANNAVAVVDLDSAKVRGFLPAGWYPTAVALTKDSTHLLIANGYGFGSVAAAAGKGNGRSYKDRAGVLALVPLTELKNLARHTAQVLKDNHAGAAAKGATPKPIEHIIYVIKENRTYDQVFGDLPQGNGDASLAIFGREVTPNHHALAEQYALLDNFYQPADQSALGHRWCTQGYASDWVFKYSNGRNDQNPMLFAPTDFIWDNARRHGVSVRAFGERGINTVTPSTATWTDIYQDWKQGTRKVNIQPRALIVGLREV